MADEDICHGTLEHIEWSIDSRRVCMDEGFDFIQTLNIVSYSYLKTVCMSCDAIIHVFGTGQVVATCFWISIYGVWNDFGARVSVSWFVARGYRMMTLASSPAWHVGTGNRQEWVLQTIYCKTTGRVWFKWRALLFCQSYQYPSKPHSKHDSFVWIFGNGQDRYVVAEFTILFLSALPALVVLVLGNGKWGEESCKSLVE